MADVIPFTQGRSPIADLKASLASSLERVPHNQEAEQAVLALLLQGGGAQADPFDEVSEFLRPEHFFDPAHQRIYQMIAALRAQNRRASVIVLKEHAERSEDLAQIGGVPYLVRLQGAVVPRGMLLDYARLVEDTYLRRTAMELALDMVIEAAAPASMEDCGRKLIERFEGRLYEAAQISESKGDEPKPLGMAVRMALEQAEAAHRAGGQITGVTTGLRDVDSRTGGLHPTDLVIIAGRPSMGKTALAVNMAMAAAREHARTHGQRGARVGVFSLEMSAEQLAARMIADEAEINGHAFTQGQLHARDWSRVMEGAAALDRLGIIIDDTAALSIEALRIRARRMRRKHKVGLIIVDYLQLLRTARRIENRTQEITMITQGLKAIAKELGVPVVALSQLSRQVEQREDKRPMLSDLRESGSIEQDADVVAFVFREEYYLERSEPQQRHDESSEKFNDRFNRWERRCDQVRNTGELIIAKQRKGPIGTVQLHWNPSLTRFSDLDTSHHESMI